ncbi:unnamed protein product [Brachionus calyciflorus]|uniref:Uncharacterized protein n=1 Tax=Brachionus calyciflorus TaxID=104777 RepID=A0A813WGW4_9BILA|nr:unnamed protein product [Brachionus calyciflorus]
MSNFLYRQELFEINSKLSRSETYVQYEMLNKEKKEILKQIEQENRRTEIFKTDIDNQKVVKYVRKEDIIKYHDNLFNKVNTIFEKNLNGLENTEEDKLNLDKNRIFDELQKVRDENLREENIGKRFKYCFVFDKILSKTINLIIANYDHDFVNFEPCVNYISSLDENDNKFEHILDKIFSRHNDDILPNEQNLILLRFLKQISTEEVKAYILLKLAECNLIIDLNNTESNELGCLRIKNTKSINGLDLDFIDQYINIKKMQSAYISMEYFHRIPKEIFRKLSNLKNLSIDNFNSYLDANDFEYLKSLEYFHSWKNIQEIRPNAFNGLNNLVYLNLKNCDLSYLEEDCFNGLVNLKYLNLESNLLREIVQRVFMPLKKLICLNLKGNKIQNLINLEGLDNILFLIINSPHDFCLINDSNNGLLNMKALIIERLTKGLEINTQCLKYVRLSELPYEYSDNAKAFFNLEFMKIDNLFKENNFLNQFYFDNLKVLIISCEKMPKFGHFFSNLKYLKISNVKEFQENCFLFLKNLIHLEISLDNEEILNIKNGHFEGLSHLIYFFISGKLSELSKKMSIFEKLFEKNQTLKRYDSSSEFKIYVEHYDSNPIFYINKVPQEFNPEFDIWFRNFF